MNTTSKNVSKRVRRLAGQLAKNFNLTFVPVIQVYQTSLNTWAPKRRKIRRR